MNPYLNRYQMENLLKLMKSLDRSKYDKGDWFQEIIFCLELNLEKKELEK